ncbi:cupin domain-containing protein [candidate division WOR-3 bacterium]|nr:cupin domain-containing protein [candidate division WOR-3 bacterium]
MDIKILKKAGDQSINNLNAENWPQWSCGIETFDWEYDEDETCIFIEGKVKIQYGDNQEVEIEEGDVVTFPKGLKCTWAVERPVRKLYKLG